MAESRRLKIEWTKIAEYQLTDILEYWDRRNLSRSYSSKLSKTVVKQVDFISRNPNSSRPIFSGEIRTSSLGHYSLYFRINEDSIKILAFWDNRQNPKKLLAQLRNDLKGRYNPFNKSQSNALFSQHIAFGD